MRIPWERYIDANVPRLVRSLQALVRIPTVNPPGERYAECVEALRDRLRPLGFETRIVRVPAAFVEKILPGCGGHPRYNLIARLDAGRPKTVHFNAHYDVVPVGGTWRHGPFDPVVRGGWVYGRGSGDMKGPIASFLHALEALGRSGIRPAYNVEVSFTADEETGGETGAGFVVRQGLVNADFAVVCEGGAGRRVGVGHNGVLWLRVEVLGKPAHASSPERGINAFEKMAGLALSLARLKSVLAKRAYRVPNGRVMRPTINLGGDFAVAPGAKVNTVPAAGYFTIDRRVIPAETLPRAEAELRRAIRAAGRTTPRLRTRVRRFLAIDPCVADPENSHTRAFSRAVAAARGGPVKFGVTSGFTDMHFFQVDGNLPTVGYGPGGKKGHGVDERIRIAELVAAAKVYATFLTGSIGGLSASRRGG
jgi:succinyl-diaminopimelate desuccinylase